MDSKAFMSALEDVTLHMPRGLQNGCSFQPTPSGLGAEVKHISPNSFVAEAAMVGAGDTVVAVNGVDVIGSPFETVSRLLTNDHPCSVTFRPLRALHKLQSQAAQSSLTVDGPTFAGLLRVRAQRGVPRMRPWLLRYFVLAQHEGEWKLGRFHSKAEFVKKGFAAGRTLPLSIVLHVDEVTNGTKDATRFNVICMTTSNGGAKLYKFQASSPFECRAWSSRIADLIGQLGRSDAVQAAQAAVSELEERRVPATPPPAVTVDASSGDFAPEDPSEALAVAARVVSPLRPDSCDEADSSDEDSEPSDVEDSETEEEQAKSFEATRKLLALTTAECEVSMKAATDAAIVAAATTAALQHIPLADAAAAAPTAAPAQSQCVLTDGLIDAISRDADDAVARAMAVAGTALGCGSSDGVHAEECTSEATEVSEELVSEEENAAPNVSELSAVDEVEVEVDTSTEAEAPVDISVPQSPGQNTSTDDLSASLEDTLAIEETVSHNSPPRTPTSPHAAPQTPSSPPAAGPDTPTHLAALMQRSLASPEAGLVHRVVYGLKGEARIIASPLVQRLMKDKQEAMTPQLLRALAEANNFSDDESDADTPAQARYTPFRAPSSAQSGAETLPSPVVRTLDVVLKGVCVSKGGDSKEEGDFILGIKIVDRGPRVKVSAVHSARLGGASATRNSWIYDSKAGISSPPEDDVAIGDTIVAVHDIPVEGLTAEEVAAMIKSHSLRDGIHLTVCRRSPGSRRMTAPSPEARRTTQSATTPSSRSHIPVLRTRLESNNGATPKAHKKLLGESTERSTSNVVLQRLNA